MISRQKDIKRPRRDFNIMMSGQFCDVSIVSPLVSDIWSELILTDELGGVDAGDAKTAAKITNC